MSGRALTALSVICVICTEYSTSEPNSNKFLWKGDKAFILLFIFQIKTCFWVLNRRCWKIYCASVWLSSLRVMLTFGNVNASNKIIAEARRDQWSIICSSLNSAAEFIIQHPVTLIKTPMLKSRAIKNIKFPLEIREILSNHNHRFITFLSYLNLISVLNVALSDFIHISFWVKSLGTHPNDSEGCMVVYGVALPSQPLCNGSYCHWNRWILQPFLWTPC